MKAFLFGLSGALIVVIATAVCLPAYINHEQRVITSEMMVYIEPQQKEVEKSLISKTAITEKVSISPIKNIQYFKLQNNGVIFVKATDKGQMLVLTPAVENNTVSWQCIGSPNLWIPPKCHGT